MDKKELKKNKRRTKIGLIEQIYYNQKIHSKRCNGKIKTAGGFLWEYKEKK